MADCYAILRLDKEKIRGLDQSGPEGITKANELVKKGYKVLAKEVHPDINPSPDADEQFRLINSAFKELETKDLRDLYEQQPFEEKRYSEIREAVDIFIKYISALAKYRPRRKSEFTSVIEEYFLKNKILSLNVIDYDLERVKIKRGAIVSVHAFGVDTEGGSISDYSLLGMVKLVMGNNLKISILDKRKAVLKKGYKAKLRIDESTRFLYDNILRNMEVVIKTPHKFENFKNLITLVYNHSSVKLGSILIEEPEDKKPRPYLKELEDPKFKFNPEQKEFINKTLNLIENDNAYVLSCNGPGGTGKTECIVEIIRQAIKTNPNIRILVASFTNVAVDNVFLKLIEDKKIKDKILRVAHEQQIRIKEVMSVSIESRRIKGASNVETVNEFKVIGATLDKLATGLFDNTFFDLVFLDEASMIEFPKVMVAASKTKKLVLIGDEFQLEPFIEQEVEDHLKRNNFTDGQLDLLKKSFFVELNKYLENTKSTALVYLVEQHRSFPEILKFSNDQWYQRLKTTIPEELKKRYEFLKNAHFDSELIHNILDPSKKVVWLETSYLPEKIKYSSNKDWHINHPMTPIKYFNPAQAAFTLLILKSLLKIIWDHNNDKDFSYRQKVGIISPFNDQINLLNKYLYTHPEYDPYLSEKIKSKLSVIDKDLIEAEKFMFLDTLESGTVHKFQGREKDIIIYDITSYTDKRDPELLKDFRVLNVALTRARCKVIIIGTVRQTTPYYSQLRNTNYVHFVGLKEGESEFISRKKTVEKELLKQKEELENELSDSDVLEKKFILESLKEINKKLNNIDKITRDDVEEILSKRKKDREWLRGFDHFKDLGLNQHGYDTFNINQYFDRDTRFKKTFFSLIDELNSIENNFIQSNYSKETSLSEEEEYDYKVEEIYKLVRLDNMISDYEKKLGDKFLFLKKMEKDLKEYIKQLFLNQGLSIEITNILRQKLTEFDNNLNKLINIIEKAEKSKSKVEQLKEYETGIKNFDSQGIPYFIFQMRINRCKIDLNFINYKDKIEALYGIKLDNVEKIIKNKIDKPLLAKLVSILRNIPAGQFPEQGRLICKNVLLNKPIERADLPLDWFKKLITSKPLKGWDVKLWLALKIKYELRYEALSYLS